MVPVFSITKRAVATVAGNRPINKAFPVCEEDVRRDFVAFGRVQPCLGRSPGKRVEILEAAM